MLGDKWTMLVVRELLGGPKRTMELLKFSAPNTLVRGVKNRIVKINPTRARRQTTIGRGPRTEEFISNYQLNMSDTCT